MTSLITAKEAKAIPLSNEILELLILRTNLTIRMAAERGLTQVELPNCEGAQRKWLHNAIVSAGFGLQPDTNTVYWQGH